MNKIKRKKDSFVIISDHLVGASRKGKIWTQSLEHARKKQQFDWYFPCSALDIPARSLL